MSWKQLVAKREDLGELLARPGHAVQTDEAVGHFWTFAGGRVNHTLKYGFEIIGDWKVVADNVQLRIEGMVRATRRFAEPLNVWPHLTSGRLQTRGGLYWVGYPLIG
jgi:hypothetical protein